MKKWLLLLGISIAVITASITGVSIWRDHVKTNKVARLYDLAEDTLNQGQYDQALALLLQETVETGDPERDLARERDTF